MSVARNPLKIYVANISRDAGERDIDKLFGGVGRITSLQYKGDFAFIEYDDERSARESIRSFDGQDLMGKRLVVQPYAYKGGDRRYRPPSNRGRFRVIIEGIDHHTSWQDVKDFARSVGRSVCFTDVYTRRGQKEAVVEFEDERDYDYCLHNLRRPRINGQSVYIRPDDDHRGGGGGGARRWRSSYRSRSRSRDRRSRSRSRGGRSPPRYDDRRRSPRRSPPRSPPRSRSRSPVRRRSPSPRDRSPARRASSPPRASPRRSPSPTRRSGTPQRRSPSPRTKTSRSPKRRED